MSLHPLQASVNVAPGSWNNTPIHGVMKYQDQNMSHISDPLCRHAADKGQRKTQKQPQTEIYRWTCNRQPAGHPETFITCWFWLWIPPVKFGFPMFLYKGEGMCTIVFLVNLNKLLDEHYSCQWFKIPWCSCDIHYCGVIMGAIASLITSLTSVYSTIHSGGDQRKHQSSTSLAFVQGIHRDRWIPRINSQ